jgi:hypothetical protein
MLIDLSEQEIEALNKMERNNLMFSDITSVIRKTLLDKLRNPQAVEILPHGTPLQSVESTNDVITFGIRTLDKTHLFVRTNDYSYQVTLKGNYHLCRLVTQASLETA